MSGSPYQSVEDCITGDLADGCDGFIEEECHFYGGDTGYSSEPGQILEAEDCQVWCLTFEVGMDSIN